MVVKGHPGNIDLKLGVLSPSLALATMLQCYNAMLAVHTVNGNIQRLLATEIFDNLFQTRETVSVKVVQRVGTTPENAMVRKDYRTLK